MAAMLMCSAEDLTVTVRTKMEMKLWERRLQWCRANQTVKNHVCLDVYYGLSVLIFQYHDSHLFSMLPKDLKIKIMASAVLRLKA